MLLEDLGQPPTGPGPGPEPGVGAREPFRFL